jgi:hypothetical protein
MAVAMAVMAPMMMMMGAEVVSLTMAQHLNSAAYLPVPDPLHAVP